MTRQEFAQKINQMIPKDTKILRSVTLAQAIIESADEKGIVANSTLTRLGNALFGIKTTKNWTGKSVNCKTREVYPSGVWHGQAAFRAYGSWQESVLNHENFLVKENPARYKNVIGEKDYKKAAQALQDACYATDRSYAKTIISVIEREKLYQYDALQSTAKTYRITFRCGTKGECESIQKAVYLYVGKYNGNIQPIINSPAGHPQFTIVFRTGKDFECKSIQNAIYAHVGKYNGNIEEDK